MAKINRRQIFEILDAGRANTRLGYIIDVLLIALISLNALAVILESVPNIEAERGAYFFGFEIFSVTLFTIQYICRVWSVVDHENEKLGYRAPINGRIRYMLMPMVIDLLAILPFF